MQDNDKAMNVERGKGRVVALLYILQGPIVWFVAFGAIYFLQSAICTFTILEPGASPAVSLRVAIIGVATIAMILLIVPLFARVWVADLFSGGNGEALLGKFYFMLLLLNLMSMFAVCASAAAVLFVPTCTSFR